MAMDRSRDAHLFLLFISMQRRLTAGLVSPTHQWVAGSLCSRMSSEAPRVRIRMDRYTIVATQSWLAVGISSIAPNATSVFSVPSQAMGAEETTAPPPPPVKQPVDRQALKSIDGPSASPNPFRIAKDAINCMVIRLQS